MRLPQVVERVNHEPIITVKAARISVCQRDSQTPHSSPGDGLDSLRPSQSTAELHAVGPHARSVPAMGMRDLRSRAPQWRRRGGDVDGIVPSNCIADRARGHRGWGALPGIHRVCGAARRDEDCRTRIMLRQPPAPSPDERGRGEGRRNLTNPLWSARPQRWPQSQLQHRPVLLHCFWWGAHRAVPSAGGKTL